jgi:hypothetical protein
LKKIKDERNFFEEVVKWPDTGAAIVRKMKRIMVFVIKFAVNILPGLAICTGKFFAKNRICGVALYPRASHGAELT